MNDTEQFQPVTFAKERESVLSDLQSKPVVLLGLTEDQNQFQFNIRSVEGEVVQGVPQAVLKVDLIRPSPRAPTAGESVQLLFGLPEGFYLLKTAISTVSQDAITIPVGQELFRLQRRNNFRVTVHAPSPVTLKLSSFKTQPIKGEVKLTPLDLSAGGFRAEWPIHSLATPVEGDAFSGLLSIVKGKQIEVFGLIKTVYTHANPIQVGVAFQNLSVKDEQVLLFICMQLQRGQMPTIR